MLATHTASRTVRLFSLTAVVLLLVSSAGCGGSAAPFVNQVLDSQILDLGGIIIGNTSRIQLINTTESDIELDVLVDGTLVTIECSAADRRCAYTPTICPLTIETVQERRLSPQGVYTGGRNFNGNTAFTFESTEFDCQSVIVYTFTEDTTTAEVL